MTEDNLYFTKFVTKSLQPINSDDRYFEGYLTVQVKDKQGEVTIVDELYKVLPVWMDRGAPISDTHSNRIIGKGINYSKSSYVDKDGSEYPAIKITGKIHKNYELDNEIWNKIKSGEYKGLSFGGATRTNREPIVMKDGSIAYALKELEHYEVAVCKDPAVPLALITDHNNVAKAMAEKTEDRGDGKMVIKCSKFGCYVKKDSLIKIEDEDDKNTKAEVLDEWKNDDNDHGEDKVKKTKQLDPDPTNADPEQIMNRAKVVGRRQDIYQSASLDDQCLLTLVENIAKTDLSKYRSFEAKVQALVNEGYAKENAENIVGSFVKGEKNKDEGGGMMSADTEGAVNTRYNKPIIEEDVKKQFKEIEQEAGTEFSNAGGDKVDLHNQDSPGKEIDKTFSGGVRHSGKEYDTNQESTQVSEVKNEEENSGVDSHHNLYNQDESTGIGEDEKELRKITGKTKSIKLESSMLINRLRDL